MERKRVSCAALEASESSSELIDLSKQQDQKTFFPVHSDKEKVALKIHDMKSFCRTSKHIPPNQYMKQSTNKIL